MGGAFWFAAAFIGPGYLCMLHGHGYNLGIAFYGPYLLSIAATVILQEMAARIGIGTQKGLANIIKEEQSLVTPWMKFLILGLILSAIVIRNLRS